MASWKRLQESLSFTADTESGPVVSISKQKLYALHYTDQCKLAYDPETPETVVLALKYSPDATVVQAAFSRPEVLSGRALNPFIGEE